MRLAPGFTPEFATAELLAGFNDALLADLQQAGLGEIVLLPWPETLATEGRPSFDTLVGRGAETGCSGVIALQLNKVSFGTKESNVPVIGTVSTAAEGQAQFGGGLVDVATAVAVAPVSAQSSVSRKNYKGPGLDELADDPAALAKSPLGQALTEARALIVKAVQAGTPRLTTAAVALPTRADAPEGVGFAQDQYRFEFSPGYDRRSLVAVVNRGGESASFAIKPLKVPGDVALGFVGQGSLDGPGTVPPGEWKHVRLVVNALQTAEPVRVKLGLYEVAAEGKPDCSGEPVDTATLEIVATDRPSELSLTVVRQDPVTLATTCQMSNAGSAAAYPMLQIEQGEGVADLYPDFSRQFAVPANSSVTFTVTPRFAPGQRQRDITLQWGLSSATEHSLPLHFAIPAGKSLYYGLSHTIMCVDYGDSGCTNRVIINIPKEMSPLEPVPRTPPDPNREVSVDPDTGSTYETDGTPRGATIRPALANRLPGLQTDTSNCADLVFTERWAASVCHYPATEGSTDTQAWITTYQANEDPKPRCLNETGHFGRWPYLAGDKTSSLLCAVWEDYRAGGKTDLAFRAGTDGVDDDNAVILKPVQYLTSHHSGINDPVVHVGPEGKVVLVAWEDLRSGTGQCMTRVSTDGGEHFAAEVPLPRAAGEWQAWPQVAAVPGGYALACVSRTGDASRIVVVRLDAAGKPAGPATALSNAGAVCGEPQLAAAGDILYAVWREGDGSASEVWSATCPAGGTWSKPVAVTRDSAYSEYPLIRVADGKLKAFYHSDVSGVTDLVYRATSTDGGATWSEGVALPCNRLPLTAAWVEVNFSLQWPRDTYRPHDTFISVNGTEVGSLKDAVPEGSYLFPVPTRVLRGNARSLRDNQITIKTGGLNMASYLMASQVRLFVATEYSQVPVVATSQTEADTLAAHAGAAVNHTRPDLALAANAMPALPATAQPGQKLALVWQVHNLGPVPATGTKLTVYNANPLDPLSDLAKAKIGEVAVGDLPSLQSRDAALTVQFDPRKTSRLYAAVQSKEEDFNASDNVWALSFTDGAAPEPTPLLGTDIPNAFYAPDLYGMVNLPDVPALQNLVSLPDFRSMVSLPGLDLPNPRDFISGLESGLGGVLPRLPNAGDLLPFVP